jgi:hypothetical protein
MMLRIILNSVSSLIYHFHLPPAYSSVYSQSMACYLTATDTEEGVQVFSADFVSNKR